MADRDSTNYSGVTEEEWTQLAAISSRHNMDQGLRETLSDNYWFQRAHDDRDDLLHIVDRLRAEVERLRAANTEHREHITSLISQLSDCESKRDADLEQRSALEHQITEMRPIVAAVADLNDPNHWTPLKCRRAAGEA